MGAVAGRGRSSAVGERDLPGELAERYVARVNLGGLALGVGAVLVVVLAQWVVTRSVFLLLTALPIGLFLLVVSTFSQSAAFIYGSRSDLPTVRALRARLRSGAPLSQDDRRLAQALARATAGARTRRRLMVGGAAAIALVGVAAVWWGVTPGHPFRIAAYGVFAFAYVVQLVVVTVVSSRIGRETGHGAPYGRGD